MASLRNMINDEPLPPFVTFKLCSNWFEARGLETSS
ncbi:hypothetical protein CCACVL1_25193 [Corchorus capsularis]|uniref:Uncharacterized protein n=1 Tax=Corchorus capsularis TaxID=210143 RepID=A0A1R3GLR6_COCAP|nr:hypothetical protein CCACVL1_25193 [Corchorus capsularis]